MKMLQTYLGRMQSFCGSALSSASAQTCASFSTCPPPKKKGDIATAQFGTRSQGYHKGLGSIVLFSPHTCLGVAVGGNPAKI